MAVIVYPQAMFKLFSILALLTVSSVSFAATPDTETPDALLSQSQKQFYKNDHDGALGTLKKYFAKVITTPKQKMKTKLRFLAIAAMGRIYLQYKHDPKGAAEWFQKLQSDTSLSEAEHDIVSGWITVAHDWEKLGKMPEKSSQTELYENAVKYYQAGLKKQKYIMDASATADFSIASAYLVPFLIQYDSSKNVGEALFMMGDMRRRMWSNNEYWSEDTYLTEAIRRFPNTPLAIKSYNALKEDIEFGNSGSSGDQVPESWRDLLRVLSRIAHGKESATPEALPEKTPAVKAKVIE
jgi:hypothetical protein